MILLQISTDTINISQAAVQTVNPWFVAEIILIISVIIWQLFLSGKIYLKIKQLKGIFTYPLKVRSGYIKKKYLNRKETAVDDIVFVSDEESGKEHSSQNDEDSVKIAITEAFGSETILRIRDYINTYLLNNYGAAVNFSIIKDFIDREADLKDEEISNSLPTPLYLGLASTMIGIICGLFAMPALDGGQFSQGIDALINGVKLAMLGSLTGLLCTTVLTSFLYKKARKSLLEDKNKQISYLQAWLLPELIKAEDTGVSGLKASLDRFARVATGISESIFKAADQTGHNILLQQDVIRQVGDLDILKISEANLDLFRRLEENMASFGKFSEYISLMSQISDNLKEFASRTRDIDMIINQIDLSLQNNARLSQFLTSHFEKIEAAGLNSLKAVDMADLSFADAIEKLETEIRNREKVLNNAAADADGHAKEAISTLHEAVENRIELLNKNEADFETKLSEIYQEISRKFEEAAAKYIQEFESAYAGAIPQFKHLDQLERLQGMQEVISSGTEGISTLIMAVNNLNSSLSNNSVLKKLDSIEDHLSRRRTRPVQSSDQPGPDAKSRILRIWTRFRKQVKPYFRIRKRK